jgi:Fur family ferric uptake transcriptional regulator
LIQRNTKQRKVILEELRKVKSHPTAQELHEIVKKKIPNISLATVYRNLERLAEQDKIHKIEVAGSDKRFDGDTSEHLHVRCSSCGRIGDLKVTLDEVINPVEIISDWKVVGSHIAFSGICPKCNSQVSN